MAAIDQANVLEFRAAQAILDNGATGTAIAPQSRINAADLKTANN